MLTHKILRSVVCLNAFRQSTRSVLSLAQSRRVLNSNLEKISTQYLNHRYIVKSKRNWDDQYKNNDKIARTLICFKYLRRIKNCIREFGPVFETNPKLIQLIKNAKEKHLSPDFIDFATKISCNIRARVGLFDLFLPNGCHFLIQYEDIDVTTTKHHLLKLCERYDGSLLQGETFWPKSFVQKGIIFIKYRNSDPFAGISEDLLSSKVEVEFCQKETDIEGEEYWKLYCDPWKLHDVKKQISKITHNIEEACIGYIPRKKIIPSPHTRSSIHNILYKLSDVPTIDNVYSNINLTM